MGFVGRVGAQMGREVGHARGGRRALATHSNTSAPASRALNDQGTVANATVNTASNRKKSVEVASGTYVRRFVDLVRLPVGGTRSSAIGPGKRIDQNDPPSTKLEADILSSLAWPVAGGATHRCSLHGQNPRRYSAVDAMGQMIFRADKIEHALDSSSIAIGADPKGSAAFGAAGLTSNNPVVNDSVDRHASEDPAKLIGHIPPAIAPAGMGIPFLCCGACGYFMSATRLLDLGGALQADGQLPGTRPIGGADYVPSGHASFGSSISDPLLWRNVAPVAGWNGSLPGGGETSSGTMPGQIGSCPDP